MPQAERKAIIEALKPVDRVILTKHKDLKKVYDRNTKEYSVCRELEELKPDIFANGGDRFKQDVPEVAICKKIGCQMVFNVGHGGKVQSSSWLLDKYLKKAAPKKRSWLWPKGLIIFTQIVDSEFLGPWERTLFYRVLSKIQSLGEWILVTKPIPR